MYKFKLNFVTNTGCTTLKGNYMVPDKSYFGTYFSDDKKYKILFLNEKGHEYCNLSSFGTYVVHDLELCKITPYTAAKNYIIEKIYSNPTLKYLQELNDDCSGNMEKEILEEHPYLNEQEITKNIDIIIKSIIAETDNDIINVEEISTTFDNGDFVENNEIY